MADRQTEFKTGDFELVQQDQVIMDQKLDSRPTTFLRDAFKRFCKNKSSVVGAVILTVQILLAVFVPVVSPHNIDNVRTSEKFLAPKVFEAGTGFWDGTRKYRHILRSLCWKMTVSATAVF